MAANSHTAQRICDNTWSIFISWWHLIWAHAEGPNQITLQELATLRMASKLRFANYLLIAREVAHEQHVKLGRIEHQLHAQRIDDDLVVLALHA